MSAPTWITGCSYSVSNIHNYFEYILKKSRENIDNLSIRIYVNKTEKIELHSKLKTDSLELLTLETIKLLGSTKNKITKDKTEIVLQKLQK